MLEFKNVGKVFPGPDGDVTALKDVSLSARPGELVAVQGPSGCGKTTMLLMGGALLKPTEGEVFVDGQDPYRLSPDQRAAFRSEKIGFVFQQFHLIPYLSVLENVLAPSVARKRPQARERAMDLIRHFELEHRVNHLPSQISIGERQRAALARALLNEPKLILADEPTGNLDEDSGKRVLGHLSEFVAGGGAVLIVTHDREIVGLAHRAVKLRQGRIVG